MEGFDDVSAIDWLELDDETFEELTRHFGSENPVQVTSGLNQLAGSGRRALFARVRL